MVVCFLAICAYARYSLLEIVILSDFLNSSLILASESRKGRLMSIFKIPYRVEVGSGLPGEEMASQMLSIKRYTSPCSSKVTTQNCTINPFSVHLQAL